jgi:hypothetical protein
MTTTLQNAIAGVSGLRGNRVRDRRLPVHLAGRRAPAPVRPFRKPEEAELRARGNTLSGRGGGT